MLRVSVRAPTSNRRRSFPMNIRHFTVITLSLTLLFAFGGGGGSGTATRTLTTPSINDDRNMSPDDGEVVNSLADLQC